MSLQSLAPAEPAPEAEAEAAPEAEAEAEAAPEGEAEAEAAPEDAAPEPILKDSAERTSSAGFGHFGIVMELVCKACRTQWCIRVARPAPSSGTRT